MSNILNFPDRSRIEEEAGYWLVRLDGGTLSEAEAAEFHAWLEADAEHRKIIIELSAMWDDMDILSELSDLFPLPQKSASGKTRKGFRLKPLLAPVAAASAVILGAVLLFQQQGRLMDMLEPAAARKESVHHTAVGERKEITLSDGSIIKLNTDSFINVVYGGSLRNLRLLKGEAHFKVAHDPSRPFVVHAGGGMVRAIGTAFSVRLKGREVEVMVTEGRVEIASQDSDDGSDDPQNADSGKYLTTLDAGKTAKYGENSIHSVKTIAPETISRKMSWQHGTLVFKGESLEEVVREISRYTDTRIIISDPELRDLRIGGYFKSGEIETLLTVLKDNFSIAVNRVNENLVYLTGDTIIQAEKTD